METMNDRFARWFKGDALACEFAASMGFKDLYNVEGGTEAWIKAGYQVD